LHPVSCALALKFPAKHRALMNFLSSVLREEGGFDYKKAIVGAILALIQVRRDSSNGLCGSGGAEAKLGLHVQGSV
jgi:hypothetical protein